MYMNMNGINRGLLIDRLATRKARGALPEADSARLLQRLADRMAFTAGPLPPRIAE